MCCVQHASATCFLARVDIVSAQLDQEPALAYLTDRYRRVAYVLSALEHEGRSGAGVNVSPLETKTRQLIAQLEEAFTCKETLAKLAAHFKVCGASAGVL